MASIAPYAFNQFFDNNGDPLALGLIYTYLAGTSTLADTYVSAGGYIKNTNPIVLDSAGRCQIWLDSFAYKFVLANASDVIIDEQDNIVSLSSNSVGSVTSYSELRVLTPGQYPIVSASGKSTAGDGYQGLFFWDNGSILADDDSLTIQPSSAPSAGRWRKISLS